MQESGRLYYTGVATFHNIPSICLNDWFACAIDLLLGLVVPNCHHDYYLGGDDATNEWRGQWRTRSDI